MKASFTYQQKLSCKRRNTTHARFLARPCFAFQIFSYIPVTENRLIFLKKYQGISNKSKQVLINNNKIQSKYFTRNPLLTNSSTITLLTKCVDAPTRCKICLVLLPETNTIWLEIRKLFNNKIIQIRKRKFHTHILLH